MLSLLPRLPRRYRGSSLLNRLRFPFHRSFNVSEESRIANLPGIIEGEGFDSLNAYYETVLHELAHWSEVRTGWKHQEQGYCNRHSAIHR